MSYLDSMVVHLADTVGVSWVGSPGYKCHSTYSLACSHAVVVSVVTLVTTTMRMTKTTREEEQPPIAVGGDVSSIVAVVYPVS
jgi:hypothetical protein